MDVPKHIALIPDGNRRWAQQKDLAPWEGHRAGIEKFKEFSEWCYDLGVKHLTAYSLSKENFETRDKKEMKPLFDIYTENLIELSKSPQTEKHQIRIFFAGDKSSLPSKMSDLMEDIEKSTEKHENASLTFCFNYSGRSEIVDACNRILKKGERCDEASFEKELQIKRPVDLLIRTSENRISNFLLWQLAYAQIYFCPKLFPDFTKDDFLDAIEQYNQTERRFGK